MRKSKEKYAEVKRVLLGKLMEENAFWSYDQKSVTDETISDDQLIAMTLRYLDLPEDKLLFSIFSYNKIKTAWKRILVPEGDYLYTLNRFFAWYYFNAKKPDAYLKTLMTRHYNNLCQS